MLECTQGTCATEATHILVTDQHEIVGGGEFFCSEHAFSDNREECSCCYDSPIEFEDTKLLPTYPAGTLGGGCCGIHP